jgi:hypothetical protein
LPQKCLTKCQTHWHYLCALVSLGDATIKRFFICFFRIGSAIKDLRKLAQALLKLPPHFHLLIIKLSL